MDIMYKEYMENTHISLEQIMWAILSEKEAKQEERLNAIESEITDLRGFIHFNNHTTNDNPFLPLQQNAKSDELVNRKIEDNRLDRKLESLTSELKEAEDKTLQVQIVGELVDEIRRMLKVLPKQKNNYRRQMLLMFHEALKQNYTKMLFNESQGKALTEVARVCNEPFVTRERYFEMDDMLCACGLDMMPDLE